MPNGLSCLNVWPVVLTFEELIVLFCLFVCFFVVVSFPIFFSLLSFPFSIPLFSLYSFYSLSIHWKRFGLSPSKTWKWKIDQL